MTAVPSDASRRHTLVGAAVLCLIFAAAIGIRVYHITDPLLEFHVTRQYRSAVIARGLYLPYNTSMPDWAREIAVANADQGALEPTIIEHLAVYGYRLAGGEHLWIGRLVSIIGWLIGGIAIWLIGRRIMSTAGALAAAIVFLLAPYGVLASRSFQPDALMTGVTALAILQIVRYGAAGAKSAKSVSSELIAAIVVTAIAAFIKPMSLFFTMGCFITIRRPRILAWEGWAFLLLSIAPMAAYYAYGLFVTGQMQSETGGRFLPHLLGTSFFWSGWGEMARTIADVWVWPLAVLGSLMARPGLPRRLFAGLWGAYLLFGVVFTYHFATHDYYHLPALIVVALGTGAAVTRLEDAAARMSASSQRAVAVAVALVMLIASAVWLQRSAAELRRLDRSSELAVYQEIGTLLKHSQRTVMLTHDYGMPIRYHGDLTGPTWPSSADLTAADLGAGAGAAEDSAWSAGISAEDRYRRFYEPDEPEYFLITDFDSFHEQEDLKPFLDETFARLAEGEGFLIYDLRRGSSR